jgi:hypothetical protein
MCDIWINVLLQTSALVGPLHIVNWNARWNSEINVCVYFIWNNACRLSTFFCCYTLWKIKRKIFSSPIQLFTFTDLAPLIAYNSYVPLHLDNSNYSSFRFMLRYPKNIKINLVIHNTWILTPWSRVLLEKLTGSAASQEIPRIYGTRKFITILTSARHLTLSWARSIQSPQPPPTSWRSILILSSHLRLGLPDVNE